MDGQAFSRSTMSKAMAAISVVETLKWWERTLQWVVGLMQGTFRTRQGCCRTWRESEAGGWSPGLGWPGALFVTAIRIQGDPGGV